VSGLRLPGKSKGLRRPFQAAAAAAASLTGTRFNLLVASSLIATAAIVAVGLTGAGGDGALAALLSQPSSEPAPAASPAPSSPSGGGASAAGPVASESSAPVGAPLAAPPSTAPPAKAPPPAEEPAAPTESLPEAGRIKHVFVISLASSGYDPAFGAAPQMPYLAGTLRPQGELLSGYSLLDDAALPNGIAAISGQPPDAKTEANCPSYDECLFPVETLTLADQLTAGRFEWRAYMEGMVDEAGKPDTCVPPPEAGGEPPAGGYAARANPFVFFHSLLDLGDCALDDVSLDRLETDLRKIDSTPNYALISPDLCNAGVTGQCPPGGADGAAAADAFLAQWAPKILASPAYEKDGLLIVLFGELNPPADGAAAPAGMPKVGALLLSHFVSPGSTDSAPYDPYSLLRTIEDLFGLEHLGEADGAKVKSLAPALLGETRGD
jgi:hypothetical protein